MALLVVIVDRGWAREIRPAADLGPARVRFVLTVRLQDGALANVARTETHEDAAHILESRLAALDGQRQEAR